MSDVIAAVATANGVSAIGIVRLSGDGAIAVAERLFRAANGKRAGELAPRTLAYGEVLGADGATLDAGLVTISRAPNSYTGEDTAELQCHGSPVVLAEVLRAAFSFGARQALAGEFTKRAFLNGRLDLTQAEAVIDVIEAESVEFAKNAAGQLTGAVRAVADGLYSRLLDISAHFQAVIDYPDEDIDDFRASDYLAPLAEIEARLTRLCATSERGRVLKSGVAAAIIGRPNVGKSSLLNAFVGYDRAIVTAAPGTTRDTVEEKLRVGATLLRLIDTAGIRETEDEAERMGVARSSSAARGAELALSVFDGSEHLTPDDLRIIETAKQAKRRIAVINKSDLPRVADIAAIEREFGAVVRVSAATGEGVEALAAAIADLLSDGGAPTAAGEILTNERQVKLARDALQCVLSAERALEDGVTPDAALTELEAAQRAIGEMTGRNPREDTVARIFERFCVGK
jgi:tRNA modification GTPase